MSIDTTKSGTAAETPAAGTAAETPGTGTAAEAAHHDPPAAPPRPRIRDRRLRRPVAFLLAVTFFFGPAVAFVVGQRPQEIENRRLRAFPSVSEGWGFFPGVTAWATDHLPLRKQAVEGNSALSESVFGEPPSYGTAPDSGGVAGVPGTGPGAADASPPSGDVTYPQVIQGKDGWLYLGSDVSGLCTPTRSVAETLARLDRLAAAVTKSGRRFVLTIAPDKSTAWPQELPGDYLGKGCAEARRAEFWKAVRATPPPGYVDLLGPIQEAQRISGQPLYRQTDTHWGEEGAALYARGLADALQPRLWPALTVSYGPERTRTGDLGKLIGRPHEDTFPGVTVSRTLPPAWDYTMPGMPLSLPARVAAGPVPRGLPLVTRPTLLLGDSFSNSSGNVLPQLFTRLTLLHNEVAAVRPDVTAAAMAKADTVVYEIVERTIASGRGAMIEDPALKQIERVLSTHPVRPVRK